MRSFSLGAMLPKGLQEGMYPLTREEMVKAVFFLGLQPKRVGDWRFSVSGGNLEVLRF